MLLSCCVGMGGSPLDVGSETHSCASGGVWLRPNANGREGLKVLVSLAMLNAYVGANGALATTQ